MSRNLEGAAEIAKQIDRHRYRQGTALDDIWRDTPERYPWLPDRIWEQKGEILTQQLWRKRVKGKSDQDKRGNYQAWDKLATKVQADGRRVLTEEYLLSLAEEFDVRNVKAITGWIYIVEALYNGKLYGHKIGKDNNNHGQTRNRLSSMLRTHGYELGSTIQHHPIGSDALARSVEKHAHHLCIQGGLESFCGEECFRITRDSAIRIVQQARADKDVKFTVNLIEEIVDEED